MSPSSLGEGGSAALSLRNLVKRYGKVTATDSVSLDVEAGEFVSLLGPSGSGKTTLLMLLAGFETADSGEIRLHGRDISRVPPNKRDIGMVFQRYALFPHMTVAQNVAFPLRMRGVAKAEQERRVKAALDMVELREHLDRVPAQLSGGQQQRVALARAIVARPKVLLLDEPLSALDKNLREAMQLELKSLQHDLGITFIFVTHDQQEALTMSDRVAVLANGRIQQLDAPRTIYDKPVNAFVASFVGASNLLDGRDEAGGFVLEDGTVLRHGGHGRASARGTALVRPEHFSLVSRCDNAPALDITLDQIVFVGSSFELFGHTASGRRLVAQVPAGERGAVGALQPGQTARWYYDPDSVHLLCDGEGAR